MERAFSLAASSSRFLGEAVVFREWSRRAEAAVISSTAASNWAWLAWEGLVKPLILRTNCSEALRISSSVSGGSKLKSIFMFRHMGTHLWIFRHAGARLRCPLVLRTCRFDSTLQLSRCSRLFGWHGGDDDHADQNAERAENGAGGQLFPAEKISYQHSHDGIDVRVGAHLGRRFVMQQPDVSGEADDGAGDDQVQQGKQEGARDGGRMKTVKIAERGSEDGEQYAAGEHLRGGAHELGLWQGNFAGKYGGDGPADRSEDQGEGAEFIDGGATEVQGVSH